jgi:RNA-directed DNA polymerase
MRKYSLKDSPLYRLRRRSQLAFLLGCDNARLLNKIALDPNSNYQFFSTVVKGKTRRVQTPHGHLKHIQKRLGDLLGRIEAPDYLHSGIKGYSYVTNAHAHPVNCRLGKTDIKAFFESASYQFVWRQFLNRFECSPDVASLLTKLTTVNGHIPTGGHVSTLLSFHAYFDMFEEIHTLCKKSGIKMTCYVDDLTFSGERVDYQFLVRVRKIGRKYRLIFHKLKVYKRDEVKIVTGVALTPQGYRIPNGRRSRIHDAFGEFRQAVSKQRKDEAAKTLIGRTFEAAQIEPSFNSQAQLALRLKNDL